MPDDTGAQVGGEEVVQKRHCREPRRSSHQSRTSTTGNIWPISPRLISRAELNGAERRMLITCPRDAHPSRRVPRRKNRPILTKAARRWAKPLGRGVYFETGVIGWRQVIHDKVSRDHSLGGSPQECQINRSPLLSRSQNVKARVTLRIHRVSNAVICFDWTVWMVFGT